MKQFSCPFYFCPITGDAASSLQNNGNNGGAMNLDNTTQLDIERDKNVLIHL